MVSTEPALRLLQDARQIPELLLLMGQHLATRDLHSYVLVCRVWHQTLIRLLWHTIDDRLHAWPRILSTHDVVATTSPSLKGYYRILAGFTRYGHHIRHLRLSWRILTNIAFVTGVCAQLEPLSTYNLLLNRIRREHEELSRISDLTEAQGGLTYDQHRNPAIEGRLLSPQFEGVFSPSEIEWRPLAEQKRGWLTAQNFWSLVQMNPTLRSLRLDQSLDSLARLESTDFFYSTLAALPQLTELDNTLVKTDLGEVLERLPNLRCNRSTNLEFPNQVLNKSYDHLHSLEIYASVPLITFFSILAQLTNLEELRIKEFVPRDRLMVNPGTYLNHTPTRLKGLHVMSDAARFGGIFAELILPWVPLLTDFTVDRLLDETVEALLVHCRKLETIRQADDGCTLYESRNTILQPTFDQTAPPGFEPLPTSKLYKLLWELPFLRVLDRIDQRMVAADVIVEIERLLPDEEVSISKADQLALAWMARIGDRYELAGKRKRSVEVQRFVLCRLGSLTNLRVLDLGYEWSDIWADSKEKCQRYRRMHMEYIAYELPIFDTLELTLVTGLDQLEGLKSLEVFGFEGVNHRIGKSELEWMAVHWPKLRVMRELQEDDRLVKIEPDAHKTELRQYMEMLRPDVKHESLSRQMSLKV